MDIVSWDSLRIQFSFMTESPLHIPVSVVAEERLSPHRGAASPAASGRIVLMAWVGSLLLHLLGLAGMLWIVFPYAPEAAKEETQAHVEIYGEVFASDLPAGSPSAPLLPPSMAKPASMPSASLDWSDMAPQADSPQPSIAGLATLDGGSSGDVAGGGPDGGSGLSIIGVGSSGGGGDFADFGISGGGGGGGPEFFGLGGSARGVKSIVYVVDSSASMLGTFQLVRAEMRRSVGKLRRSQKFHVLFFNSGEPNENPPQKLVNAIDAQKKAFFEFLEAIRPGGNTHPEAAMRRALALEPDLIYFLTDGEFDPGLVPKLNEWNKERRVRIFTIAYFDMAGAALLERIAREHKGEFKFVSDRDLP